MISRLIAALLLSSVAAASAQPRAASDRPSYVIVASIDPATRRIDGRERIAWINRSARPARELQLYLHHNANAPRSMIVTAVRDLRVDRDVMASIEGGSTAAVLRVPLEPPVAAGASAHVDVEWTATLPEGAATQSFVLAAHWFPQLAVLADDGWVAHQDAARSFTFADAAAFDVTIAAPAGWDVAATGGEQAPAAGGARRFVEAAANDFAFAVGRGWVVDRARVDRAGSDAIDARVVLQPEHTAQAARVKANIRSALARADLAVAPYPYRSLTIVDVPTSVEGVVAPSFVTFHAPWIAPMRVTELETAIARAIGAHSWHSVVAADPITDAWLADGMSAYAAGRVAELLVERQLESTLPEPFLSVRFFGGFVPYPIRSIRASDVRGESPATVRAVRVLQTLERYLGWPALETILTEFEREFLLAHPTTADFGRIAEAVSGRDLRWFFDEAVASSRTFDYGVSRVDASVAAGRYRSVVTIERKGDGIFSGSSRAPIAGFQSGRAIEVATAFADGTTLHDTWDGRAPSTTFQYDSAAPLESVTVDPEWRLALDRRRVNNSWAAAPRGPRVATQWSAPWMLWLEDFLITWGLFV